VLTTSLLFVLGIALLYGGAEMLVRGASRLALSIGIRPLVVGLTVVAMGTSFPEFTVSFLSAIRESKDIALGNIIGSNIANIGLVVGLAALVRPLSIQVNTVRRELPFLIFASILFYFFSLDGMIGRVEGVLLFAGFLIFIAYTVRMAANDRRETANIRASVDQLHGKRRSTGINLVLTLLGLISLVFGSYLIVNSAVTLAKALGVSEVVIGITMVAVGTSLPEVAISTVGAYHGQADLAVGNAVGSNLFNTLFVIAIVTVVYPIPVEPGLLRFEYLFMLGFVIVLLPFIRSGFVLNRWEGGFLLAAYIFFIALLFIR